MNSPSFNRLTRSVGQTKVGTAMTFRQSILECAVLVVLAFLALHIGWSVAAFDWVAAFSAGQRTGTQDILATVFFVVALALPVWLIRSNWRLVTALRERARAEARALDVSRRDPLTGLPNRRVYPDLVQDILTQPGGPPVGVFVLLIDLDRFKPINDMRGHEAGDMILTEVAARLRRLCGPFDTAIRLGGDEFAIVVAGQTADFDPTVPAMAALDALRDPFAWPDWSADLSASIGIARWAHGDTPADLLRKADQAMYRAKDNGRGCLAVYDEDLGDSLRHKAMLELDLRRAIDADQIIPYFQPVVEIETGRLLGFEALARWPHPTSGMIPPDQFVPVAEELGLIDRMSDQLFARCCIEMQGWDPTLRLSFNLSPVQLCQGVLAARIAAILRAHDIDGHRIEFEITETAVITDIDRAYTVILELRALGVEVSLDDFGTGTSSLAVLSRLPFNSIKIDRSFVIDIGRHPENAKIVCGVLALADSLGIDVTAEGIEQIAELDFLRQNGCGKGQGYLFSRPVPASEVADLIKSACDMARAPERATVPPVQSLHSPVALRNRGRANG